MPRFRRYRAWTGVTYLGGTLPADSYQALAAALRDTADGELSCTVAAGDYDTFVASVWVRAANPLDAITGLSTALDRALMATGLFEEFDVSGRTLHAEPAPGGVAGMP